MKRREKATVIVEEPRAVRVQAVVILYELAGGNRGIVAEKFLDGLSPFGLRALDLRIADLRAEGHKL